MTSRLVRPSFLHPAIEVVGGLWVVGDPDHGDAPQRRIGLSVATVVPAQMSCVLPGVCRDRGHAAQMGPGGLGMEAFGIVTGRHQKGGGGIGPDTEQGHQVGGGGEQQRLDLLVQFADLLIETLDAVSQRRQRCLGGCGHWIG
jgi:hypothetical protein